MKPKKQRNGFFIRLMLVLNGIVAAFLLFSYLAPVTDPSTFWPIAFFGLAYPFLLLANFLFILFWLFIRWKYALVSFVAVLLGWKVLNNNIGFRGSTAIAVPKSSPDFIRIVTYNVHFFKKFDGGEEYDPVIKDQILDLIRQEQPDVLCIQEFLTQKSGDFNTDKSIKAFLKTKYKYYVASMDNDFESLGLAIYSKFPIKGTKSILFPGTVRGNEAIWAEVIFKEKPVRIYNVHFQSIGFQPQDYQYINEVKQAKTEGSGSGRRILSRLKQAFIKRSEQIKIIKKDAAGSKGPYIIAGDFNDTPASYAVNSMAKGLHNSFREKGSGFGVTYNGDFPNFQIDYILSSQQFKVINYRILDKKLSDHYGIRSDLELAN